MSKCLSAACARTFWGSGKQHFLIITSGFASVKQHFVNLQPVGPPLSLVTEVTGAFAEARISGKKMYSKLSGISVCSQMVALQGLPTRRCAVRRRTARRILRLRPCRGPLLPADIVSWFLAASRLAAG